MQAEAHVQASGSAPETAPETAKERKGRMQAKAKLKRQQHAVRSKTLAKPETGAGKSLEGASMKQGVTAKGGGASARRRRKGGKQAGNARSNRRERSAEKSAEARDEAALDAAAAQWAALKRQSAQAQGRILAPGAALRLAVLAIVLTAWYFLAPAPKVVSRM